MRPSFLSRCCKSPDINVFGTSVAKLSDYVFVVDSVEYFMEPDYIAYGTYQF